MFFSNNFGIDSSELEESKTGRYTGAVRGLTAGATALGGAGGDAGRAAGTGQLMDYLEKHLCSP